MGFVWECMVLSLKVGLGSLSWAAIIFLVISIIAGIVYLIENR